MAETLMADRNSDGLGEAASEAALARQTLFRCMEVNCPQYH